MLPVQQILKILKRRFPQAGAMEIGSPYQNLVAVALSARTRDEQVLKLLPGFFKEFPTVEKLSRATTQQIEQKINTIGMYRQKAKNLKKMATVVVEKFEGKIPSNMQDLVSLAGVGRKTASVILVASFHTPAIAVDTHVHRVTNRLGWVKTKTPEKTEQALLKLIPKKWQSTVNRVFVKFGRYICLPGKPRCWMCPIRSSCAYQKKQLDPLTPTSLITEKIVQQERTIDALKKNIKSLITYEKDVH